jgi:hypothetical protein
MFRRIELFLGDLGLGLKIERGRPGRGEILVIGSGSAGLTIASDLLSEGFSVTVQEREGRAGGWLRRYPPFRLPADIVDMEVARLISSGINFRLGQEFAPSATFPPMPFEALALAIGAPGCPADGRLYVNDVIYQSLKGSPPDCEGYAVECCSEGAVDLARLLMRIRPGAPVILFGKPPEADLDLAMKEGLALYLSAPVSEGAGGSRCIIYDKCDGVAPPFPLEIRPGGFIEVDSRMQTSTKRVYAAGSAVGRLSSVTESMASGRSLAAGLILSLILNC